MRLSEISSRAGLACLAGLFLVSDPAQANEPRVMGWIEAVTILPQNLTLSAKLDTGAKTSSVDVRRFTEFRRYGRPWVRFDVSDRNGGKATFELPVVRVARVRRSESVTKSRPVVMMRLCLGGIHRSVEVNLADRSNLDHPMLIGRSALTDKVIVDPSRTNTAKPDCRGR